MNFITNNTTAIFNILTQWKNTKEKHIIIDPISCLVKLSILSFYPSGTKISISDHMISIVEPGLFQGAFRFFKGDGRDDLHNLYIPIIKSIEWYWNKDNIEIGHLFNTAIKGLENLKSSYPALSIISHTLDLYIHHLLTKQIKNFQNKEIKFNDNEHNLIHDYLKKLWTDREIHIIIEMILEYDRNAKINKYEKQILDSILQLTNAKELKLKDFLQEHFASL